MKCPRCEVNMKVTHSIVAGTAGKTQRLVCPECSLVGTAVTVFVNFDPGHGEGAYEYAKRMKEQNTPPSLVFAAEGGGPTKAQEA